MLDCLEVDIEVSDVDMENAGFDNCRKVLGDDRNTNSVLAVM